MSATVPRTTRVRRGVGSRREAAAATDDRRPASRRLLSTSLWRCRDAGREERTFDCTRVTNRFARLGAYELHACSFIRAHRTFGERILRSLFTRQPTSILGANPYNAMRRSVCAPGARALPRRSFKFAHAPCLPRALCRLPPAAYHTQNAVSTDKRTVDSIHMRLHVFCTFSSSLHPFQTS